MLWFFSFQTDDLQGHIIICGFGRVGQVKKEYCTPLRQYCMLLRQHCSVRQSFSNIALGFRRSFCVHRGVLYVWKSIPLLNVVQENDHFLPLPPTSHLSPLQVIAQLLLELYSSIECS